MTPSFIPGAFVIHLRTEPELCLIIAVTKSSSYIIFHPKSFELKVVDYLSLGSYHEANAWFRNYDKYWRNPPKIDPLAKGGWML